MNVAWWDLTLYGISHDHLAIQENVINKIVIQNHGNSRKNKKKVMANCINVSMILGKKQAAKLSKLFNLYL